MPTYKTKRAIRSRQFDPAPTFTPTPAPYWMRELWLSEGKNPNTGLPLTQEECDVINEAGGIKTGDDGDPPP